MRVPWVVQWISLPVLALHVVSVRSDEDGNSLGETCIVTFGQEAHRLAAKELRRVIFSATRQVPFVGGKELLGSASGAPRTIFVLAKLAELDALLQDKIGAVVTDGETHVVWSASTVPHHVIVLSGNTDTAVLHAVYSAAEHLLGVRFLISSDVIPRLSKRLPEAKYVFSPRFSRRGLQPFHDFAVGPDWWSLDDYKMVMAQQRRMKMNFIGFHSYPFANETQQVSASGDPLTGRAEPLVWVGKPSDLNADGSVKASGAYPAYWRTTGDDGWGLTARNTSSYVAGASQLFPRDCYGSPAQETVCIPSRESASEQARIINGAAALLGNAFSFARSMGITTAVGTQVPLDKPEGMSVIEAWEGMFKRIDLQIKPDFYWHWTSEAYEQPGTPSGLANSSTTKQIIADIQASVLARQRINASFELATCGWEVGPSDEPALFDHVLAADVKFLSAIGERLGWDPVQPGFSRISRRPAMAIPWMEDDHYLIGAEFWVNRTLTMASQAESLGVEGLGGIHWRTFESSLTISALAQVAWHVREEREGETKELSVEGFYRDFAVSAFGEDAGPAAAAIFLSLDSFEPGFGQEQFPDLHYASGSDACYAGGGGHCRRRQPPTDAGTFTCCARWASTPGQNGSAPGLYSYAERFAALRSKVPQEKREVFDHWCGLLRYTQHLAEVQEAVIRFKEELTLNAAVDASVAYSKMLTSLQSFVHTQGSLGLITQHENMNWADNFGPPLQQLAQKLGHPVPESAMPTKAYRGTPRVFCLTVRTLVSKQEDVLILPLIVQADASEIPRTITVFFRALANIQQQPRSVVVPRTFPGRSWFNCSLPVGATDDLEWWAEVPSLKLRYPQAPNSSIVVVVTPDMPAQLAFV